MSTTIVLASFIDGPLDGQPPASFDDLPETDPVPIPDRVVYVQHPLLPGAGAMYYGATLDKLAAPLEGQPDQHVYQHASGDIQELDMRTMQVIVRRKADRYVLARFTYRGPFPQLDVPLAEGPEYVGPCKIGCAHGCVLPPGLKARELLIEDTHDPELLDRADGCPCGRLFLTDRATS